MNYLMRHIKTAVFGFVDHGKTSFIECLDNQSLTKYSDESKYGITVMLGYKLYSHMIDDQLVNIELFDSPGHSGLSHTSYTVLSMIECPILILDITKIDSINWTKYVSIFQHYQFSEFILALSKIDTISESTYQSCLDSCQRYLKNFKIQARICPISIYSKGSLVNLIKNLTTVSLKPLQGRSDFDIIMSFNINKPRYIKSLKGAVIGGMALKQLKVGDSLFLGPILSYEKNKPRYLSIKPTILGIRSANGESVSKTTILATHTLELSIAPELASSHKLAGLSLFQESVNPIKELQASINTLYVPISPKELVVINLNHSKLIGTVSQSKKKLNITLETPLFYNYSGPIIIHKKQNTTMITNSGNETFPQIILFASYFCHILHKTI